MELFGIDFGCAIDPLSNGKVPDFRACLLPLLSKLIGYWIVATSATVKLPQIMKVVNSKSAKGLSILSFELDVVGYTIALSYCVNKGLPFSAYGELAFLLFQAIMLILVIYYYSQPLGTRTLVRPLLYFVVAPFLFGGQIDPVLFEALYACQHAIFFSARIPQIWKNFKNKSTGQLSFMTSSMNLGASVARIFTSIQESAPATVTFGCLRSTLTNGILVSQIVMYRKKQTHSDKEKKTK